MLLGLEWAVTPCSGGQQKVSDNAFLGAQCYEGLQDLGVFQHLLGFTGFTALCKIVGSGSRSSGFFEELLVISYTLSGRATDRKWLNGFMVLW